MILAEYGEVLLIVKALFELLRHVFFGEKICECMVGIGCADYVISLNFGAVFKDDSISNFAVKLNALNGCV